MATVLALLIGIAVFMVILSTVMVLMLIGLGLAELYRTEGPLTLYPYIGACIVVVMALAYLVARLT